MILAERTGWSLSEIRSLEDWEFAAFIEVHNELVEEAKREAEGE